MFQFDYIKPQRKKINMLSGSMYRNFPLTNANSCCSLLLLIHIILICMVNCEQEQEQKFVQSGFISPEGKNIYIRASTLDFNKGVTPVVFPKGDNIKNNKDADDSNKSSLIRFPTSTKSIPSTENLSITERPPKRNTVKIVQNYSVLNIFNASKPNIDSNRLETNNLIEYLSYLHQLPPEDAAAVQQLQNQLSNIEEYNNIKEGSSIGHPFSSEIGNTTESPIETLDRLRQKLPLLSTTVSSVSTSLNNDLLEKFNSSTTSSIILQTEDSHQSSDTAFNHTKSKNDRFSISFSNGNRTMQNNESHENIEYGLMPIEIIDNSPDKHSDDEYIFSANTENSTMGSISTIKNNFTPFSPTNFSKLPTTTTTKVPPLATLSHTQMIKSLDTNTNVHSTNAKNFEKITESSQTHINEHVPPAISNTSNKTDLDNDILKNTNHLASNSNANPVVINKQNSKTITANTNAVHNFESIEIGVVVGVAIGVFIVLICSGSVMVCIMCGRSKQNRRGHESVGINGAGDCANGGCSGSSLGVFFFGRRNVYATRENMNEESGPGESQLGYTSIYPTGGYFKKSGPPVILPHELVLNYDDGNTDSFTPITEGSQNIAMNYNITNAANIAKRARSDKVTEL